jgi:hypothetical protein
VQANDPDTEANNMAEQPQMPPDGESAVEGKGPASQEPALAELISAWYREARAKALAHSRIRRSPKPPPPSAWATNCPS